MIKFDDDNQRDEGFLKGLDTIANHLESFNLMVKQEQDAGMPNF